MGITFKIQNLDKVLAGIESANRTQVKQLETALDDFGRTTVREAKQRVPKDEGRLAASISYQRTGFKVEVVAQTDYAAYVEFGTRKFADAYVNSLPQDWATYAASFKGKGGGSMEEFLQRIIDWVKRKGISGTYSVNTRQRTGSKGARNFEDAEVAYPIALAILRNGIKAQPYLYPAYQIAVKEFIDEAKNIFGK